MNTGREPFTDADLQALLDCELSPAERAAVTAWVQASGEAQARLAVLRAVHDAVADFAAATPIAVGGGGAVGAPLRRPALLWNWRTLLAAAAVLVVGLVFYLRPRPDAVLPAQGKDSAENELCRLQVVPLHGGSWPLFSAIAIELRWLNKGDKPLRVLGSEGDVAAAADAALARGEMPLRLEAVIRAPGGRELHGSVRAPTFVVPVAATAPLPLAQRIELWQVAVQDPALAPIFGIGVDGTEWRVDKDWCLLHFARELPAGERWFVPQEVGEYQLDLRAVGAAGKSSTPAPTVGPPLAVTQRLRVEATASAWSEPSDGLRARIIASRPQLTAGQPTAMALQLRNESGRMRQYNVVGSTLAPIPQPYHFDLLVDGVAWQQDERRSMSFSGEWMFAEQADGTLRSIVVLPEQWQHDGVHLSDLPGEHRLQFHFHFVPTMWSGGDSLWDGEVTTPELKVTVGKPK